MVPTTFLSRMDAASTALGGGAWGVVPAGFGKGFLYEVMVCIYRIRARTRQECP